MPVLKHFIRSICCLLLAPVPVYAQSELSGAAAFSVIGVFLVCLLLFFQLIRFNTKTPPETPKASPSRKERRARSRHRVPAR